MSGSLTRIVNLIQLGAGSPSQWTNGSLGNEILDFEYCEVSAAPVAQAPPSSSNARATGAGAQEVHRAALAAIRAEAFEVIILDLQLPGKDGIEVLQTVRREAIGTPVLIMTSYSTVQSAVEAMKQGAVDYISKPFNHDEMIMTVKRILDKANVEQQNTLLQKEVARNYPIDGMVAHCEPMLEVLDRVRRVAATNTTVLIVGETGTGKELVARAIHSQSELRKQSLVTVNCAAFAEDQIESELFGYEKGAFTHAIATKPGLLEEAQGGSIFLDEVGEMPLKMQAKLLSVLETKTFRRLGSNKPIEVDIRIIAATNRDLQNEVDEKRFREDLYYRLNVVSVTMPPLRELGDDILTLSQYLLKLFNVELKKEVKGFTEEARQTLLSYSWPGNVRELSNCLERAMIFADKDMLDAPDLTILGSESHPTQRKAHQWAIPPGGIVLEDVEQQLILSALEQSGNYKSKAARLLGLTRDTLRYRLEKYKIT